MHRGRKGWAEKQAFDARDYADSLEAAEDQRLRERCLRSKDRAMSMCGHNRMWSLNRSMIPKRGKRR
jgi:hypothetical protein